MAIILILLGLLAAGLILAICYHLWGRPKPTPRAVPYVVPSPSVSSPVVPLGSYRPNPTFSPRTVGAYRSRSDGAPVQVVRENVESDDDAADLAVTLAVAAALATPPADDPSPTVPFTGGGGSGGGGGASADWSIPSPSPDSSSSYSSGSSDYSSSSDSSSSSSVDSGVGTSGSVD